MRPGAAAVPSSSSTRTRCSGSPAERRWSTHRRRWLSRTRGTPSSRSPAISIRADVDVRIRVRTWTAGGCLIACARQADLVVVGSRGHNEVLSLLLGSTSLQVAMHAASPVVVVRISRRRDERTVGRSSRGRCRRLLPERRRGGVRVRGRVEQADWPTPVHAWTTPESGAESASKDVSAETELHHRRLLAGRRDSWQLKYPDVDVTLRVVRSDPARALVEESPGAALTVVGSRGHGGFAGCCSARSATRSSTSRTPPWRWCAMAPVTRIDRKR